MRTAVLTDSTAYIPEKVRSEWGIHMLPLSVVFNETAYREEMDITTSTFYDKMRQADQLPKTTQPAIGLITTKLEELANQYDSVIAVHLSSGISGTMQAVASAGDMVEGIDVYAYDSELSCMGQGFFVLEAAKMAKQNAEPQQILQRFDQIKQSIRAYFMVDDLQNLHRGGRLNGAQAIIGSLLQVKPILHFVDKVIVPFEKIRTRKKAINRIVGLMTDDLETGKNLKVVIIHANCLPKAEKLQADLLNLHPQLDVTISYFGPVIGTHLGEGAIGMTWYDKN